MNKNQIETKGVAGMIASFFSSASIAGSYWSSSVASVSAALSYMPELKDADIDVTSSSVALILNGTVPTQEARTIAITLARDLSRCPVHDQLMLSS